MMDLRAYCSVAIATLVLLASAGIPVPVPLSIVLIGAGVLAAHGAMNVASLVLLAAGSAVLGDTLGYVCGRLGIAWFQRYGATLTVRSGRSAYRLRMVVTRILMARVVRRAIGWTAARLARGGGMGALILLSRTLLGAFGPVINVLSGIRRYPFGRFLLYDAVGETIWAGVYIGLGFVTGTHVHDAASLVTNPVMIFLMLALTIAPLLLVARTTPPGDVPARPSLTLSTLEH